MSRPYVIYPLEAPDGTVHPWQALMKDWTLPLHGPVGLGVDLDGLRADFARLDAAMGPEARMSSAWDQSWSNLPLIDRGPDGRMAGTPRPALAHMPTAAALLAGSGLVVRSSHIFRLPPYSALAWHFEEQTPRSDEMRILIPLEAPAGAATLIGAGQVAYGAGQAWTGDFAFPHKVENVTPHQRLVLIADVTNDAVARGLIDPALWADADGRRHRAGLSQGMLTEWRRAQT